MTEPQNTEVQPANQDSSSAAQQLQETQQAKEVAKSRLGEIQTLQGMQISAQYNPKELSVDKVSSSQKSSTSNEVDPSTKNQGILYNGHAGPGENTK
jgi:hypothetical protein